MKNWFNEPGAYVLVDGQFGSTGKGLLAGYIAEQHGPKITHVTTNAGPNSGHTAYYPRNVYDGEGEQQFDKVMAQQLPVASVFMEKMGLNPFTILNAGAVIDPDILAKEVATYFDHRHVIIHPNAALINEEDKKRDQHTVRNIAGTGKGIGPAQASKVNRLIGATASVMYHPMIPDAMADRTWDSLWDWTKDRVFVETAQGYSLGLNSSRFYPNVTSRECTVMQAIADARIPAQMVKGVVACYRTFPIRVGSTENSSGGCYEDQEETTWEALGLEPELTTVTKRVRRVFTWSRIQFRESLAANRPDTIFLNFCNYLTPVQLLDLMIDIQEDYSAVMRQIPDAILLGYGPYSSDIKEHKKRG